MNTYKHPLEAIEITNEQLIFDCFLIKHFLKLDIIPIKNGLINIDTGFGMVKIIISNDFSNS